MNEESECDLIVIKNKMDCSFGENVLQWTMCFCSGHKKAHSHKARNVFCFIGNNIRSQTQNRTQTRQLILYHDYIDLKLVENSIIKC